MKNFVFSRELNKELGIIDETLRESLNSWWDEIEVFANELEADPLWKSIPEFVLLAYDYFEIERDLSIKMAVIFKMVYLTKHIHGTIKDDEEGQEYNQLLQFTILIGDYLSGLTMSLLLKNGWGELIDSFADLMIDINEGLIIKHKIAPDSGEAVEKASASLYKTIFITAARIAGVTSKSELEIANRLGTHVGMVMVLLYSNAAPQEISKYIIQANQLFIRLSQSGQVIPGNLEMALRELTDFSGNLKKVAAI